ncbi:GNAT family N-acetyltransferase [Nonomuraea sp. NPDC049784]|uniref:GNAT family N-acetyltransferase n=1 Tax=Nonomuraea sp. NPDC049784 TaxID=3154361 RepID=UPI0033C10D2E
MTGQEAPSETPSAQEGAAAEQDDLSGIWPLVGLRLTTERLELALPNTRDLVNLCRAAGQIQSPGEPRFQQSYLYALSPERERQLLQRHWRALAHWRPDSWDLHLAIRLNGTAIGLQNMWATNFVITRTVETGSWITLAHQGRGYGTEARAAVLELAFTHLGAVEACTKYVDGNAASAAVSRKLGYRNNGHRVSARDGERLLQHLMVVDAATWRQHSHGQVDVIGLACCLGLFGVAASEEMRS